MTHEVVSFEEVFQWTKFLAFAKDTLQNLIEKISCKKFKNTKTYLNETMFENQEQQKYMW